MAPGTRLLDPDRRQMAYSKLELTFQANQDTTDPTDLVAITVVTGDQVTPESMEGNQLQDNKEFQSRFLGENWRATCLRVKEYINSKNTDDELWKTLKSSLKNTQPTPNHLEYLAVWETQQHYCREIITALKTQKIPERLRNFITHHNLQLLSLPNLEQLELIVSVRRNIRESRKRLETLRRTYLPNAKVNRRNFNRSGGLTKMTEALKQLQQKSITVMIPYQSKLTTQLVTHLHDKVTAHGSLQIVKIAVQLKWFIPKLTGIYKWVQKNCINCRFIDTQPFSIPEGDLLGER